MKVPRHIGIIPDGNRRYSEKFNISIEKAYAKGIEKLMDVIKWSKEKGIKIITVWGFSLENFKRSAAEKRLLFKMFENKIKELINSGTFEKARVCVKIIGHRELFPRFLQETISKLEASTSSFKSQTLNIALGYSGRQDIIDACNRIISSGIKRIDVKSFPKFLTSFSVSDPDLVIRTSGEIRTSGFFPWQTVYSEFVFLKPLWPEITKRDFEYAINEFSKRQRRFGR